MAADKNSIIALPNPLLRERSKRIAYVGDDVKQLIKDMQDATIDWEANREHEAGVALAAVQIGQLERAVIVRNNFDNKSDQTFSVFINPKITKFEGRLEEDFEGCLSVPDIYGKVSRYTKVRVKALGLDGREIRLTAEGFLARVMQHEIDHTNGIVFIDHIKEKPEAYFRLTEDGHLEKLDYEQDVRTNNILW